MFISRHMLTEMSTIHIKLVKRYAKLESTMEVECSTSISTDEEVKGENESPDDDLTEEESNLSTC